MSEQNPQPFFNMQRIYLKDLSLEQPNSPDIFLNTNEPTIEVEVNIDAKPLTESIFESVITGTVTAKIDDKVALLIEAKQAGIFEIRHVPAADIEPLMHIACPTILFPYLRANIADVVTRAGFPPIHLIDINFQALYEQQRAHAAAQSANEAQSNPEDDTAADATPPTVH